MRSRSHGLCNTVNGLRTVDQAQLTNETLEFRRIKCLGEPISGLLIRRYLRDVDKALLDGLFDIVSANPDMLAPIIRHRSFHKVNGRNIVLI